MPLLVYQIKEGKIRRAKIEDYIEIVSAILQLIPEGRVSSYGSIAKALNVNPKLIGKIMKLNKHPIVYPCHRIIKSDGKIGGYSGPGGQKFKKMLLEFEGVKILKNDRVDLESFIDINDLCR
ncbi:MAG: MGMT family protein [Candidatus Methanomethylicia archaeon]